MEANSKVVDLKSDQVSCHKYVLLTSMNISKTGCNTLSCRSAQFALMIVTIYRRSS